MTNSLDILAFSPHPDDAELGCAGSLILAVERGLRVAIADMSDGEKSSRGAPEQRDAERKRSGDLMGVRERFSLRLPDSEIGTHPDHRLPIIRLIRQTKPKMILAPYYSDRHPDHAAAGRLVREASFYSGVTSVGTGRPHRPNQIYHYMIHYPFRASFVVDISYVWERKKDVLMSYQSQFQSDGKAFETAISKPEFFRFIETRAVWFGAMIGVAYGEPFFAPGPISLRQLPSTGSADLHRGPLPRYGMFI